MNEVTKPQRDRPVYASHFLNARREAWIILASWAVCLVWTVGYCAVWAYGEQSDPSLVLGMPEWVFWGVLAPWAGATVFSAWYGLFRIADDDLGRNEPSGSGDVQTGGSPE